MGKYIDQHIKDKLAQCNQGQAPRAISLLKSLGMAARELACNRGSQLQKREACERFQQRLRSISSSSSDEAPVGQTPAGQTPAGQTPAEQTPAAE